MDFSREDRIDSNNFNRIIWNGLEGDKPYPNCSDARGRLSRTRRSSRIPVRSKIRAGIRNIYPGCPFNQWTAEVVLIRAFPAGYFYEDRL
jgi:hypothetical protein